MRSRSLSEAEARVVLGLEARGQEVVTMAELRRSARVSNGFARKIAHNLLRKGWLQRVRAGTVPPESKSPWARRHPRYRPAPHRVAPRGPLLFWVRHRGRAARPPPAGRTRGTYLVTPQRSQRLRRGNVDYRLVHAPLRSIWGTRTVERRGVKLVVSDPERTFVDSLSRPELAGGIPGAARILFAAKPTLQWDQLVRYVRRIHRPSLGQRVGFLASRVRPELPMPVQAVRALRPGRLAAYAALGPPSVYGRRGRYVAEWRILDNVGPRRLVEEVRPR